jgi:pimeloyl-ACP methyl ester carboxylesterase
MMMDTAQSTSMPPKSTDTGIGGVVQKYLWTWERQPLAVVYEILGEGTPVLLLPAFSTVSTRGEMRAIAERLSSQFQVMTLDWPGFGQSERLPIEYRSGIVPEVSTRFCQGHFEEANCRGCGWSCSGICDAAGAKHAPILLTDCFS